MRTLLWTFLTIQLWAAPTASPPKGPPCEKKPYFDCMVPSGWGVTPAPPHAGKSEKVYGLEMVGPRGPSGAFVRISADYFTSENKLHKSPDAYIKRAARLQGGIGVPGEKTSAPQATVFKGRKATRISRKTFDFIRISPTSDKKVTVQEDILVITAEKGFYVIKYASPPDLVSEHMPSFERFLESFSPSVK